jgi:hypothetical protein
VSALGEPRQMGSLAWITKPGKADKPEQAVIVESPDAPVRPSKPEKPEKKTDKPKKGELLALPDIDESLAEDEKITLLVRPELAKRLYSEAFHDPMRRWMKEVIVEILEEALAKRPNKGPAPPQFIQGLKARGKRKKS